MTTEQAIIVLGVFIVLTLWELIKAAFKDKRRRGRKEEPPR